MARFLIADTHFDDENAIDYHIRPFNDVDHMNETMVHNWNRVVSHTDTVVILGDFTGTDVDYETAEDWASLLNGKKRFVLSDNDHISSRNIPRSRMYEDKFVFSEDGYDFYCTHDPDDIPEDWMGWGIHGNSHQLHPQDYPLYNYQHMRINVSAEQIGYTPIRVSAITEMLEAITHSHD